MDTPELKHGETGEIVDIGPASLTLRMEDAQGERVVDYEREDWPQLQLAYAITSHRSRGVRVDNVVVVVSQSHFMMLQRNLLLVLLVYALGSPSARRRGWSARAWSRLDRVATYPPRRTPGAIRGHRVPTRPGSRPPPGAP